MDRLTDKTHESDFIKHIIKIMTVYRERVRYLHIHILYKNVSSVNLDGPKVTCYSRFIKPVSKLNC